MNGKRIRIKRECNVCHGTIEVEVGSTDYTRWMSGEHIQKTMPYLSPGQRELLISGTCEPCFDKMWPEEEE